MLNLIKSRTKNVLSNEIGSSNVEIIIWIAVVLLIGVVLMAFGRLLRFKSSEETNSIISLPVQSRF